MIPFTQFSNRGEILHFAHANGYPVGCYSSFLKPFFNEFKVLGMHARPLWGMKEAKAFSSWDKFGQDFTAFSKEHNLNGIIGIGHSMGAISSLKAARKNPNLFKKLILLDPVIPPPLYDKLSLLPFFIAKRINPMVKVAMRRRDSWDSREEAILHFKSKKAYARFDEQSFQDFIDFGLKCEEGKYSLLYPRELEAKVYSTVPSVWNIIKNPPCPIVILRAQFSNVIVDHVWSRIQKVSKGATLISVENVGHMMPLEQPEKMAKMVMEQIKL